MKLPSSIQARWLAQYIVPHERAIRSWLARRTHDLDIDDIIQEMYARLASLEDVENIRNARQYAAQTAISIALNQARHARVVSMIPFGDLEELGLASLEPSPERAVNSQEELRDLENALQELPPLCRTAFLLRRVEGLSQKEVAEKLGISVKTVEKYMARSVRFLIRIYGRGGGSGAQVSKDAGGNHAGENGRTKLSR
ncbi:MAG TPA: sigma-70 family RNA polymerase sigma factor [Rhizomicrobium sp.]|nr:sigma-70 family RNA polymerase sigma factor [Rhizomicrobium sp.]